MLQHRHLIVRGLGQASESFEPYGGGSARRPAPVPNREEHASRLRSDLMKITDQVHEIQAEQATLGIPAKKRGITVTVLSREGEELAVSDALRANSKSMQLLKVRRGADVQGRRGHDRAVYCLGEKSIETLEDNLLSYENWGAQDQSLEKDALKLANEPKSKLDRRPRNFWLFESAASFKIAKVEDLWTDALENFPREKGAVEWEIWIRDQMRAAFDAAVEQLGIKIYGRPSKFVDILVYNGFATKAVLSRLIAQSAAVVELRGASNFIAQHADLPPPKRLAQIQSIAQRVVPAPNQAPWVTLLDTGVNPASPLIAPALPTERCRAITNAWDSFDPDGHGSKMAGVALYGDLVH